MTAVLDDPVMRRIAPVEDATVGIKAVEVKVVPAVPSPGTEPPTVLIPVIDAEACTTQIPPIREATARRVDRAAPTEDERRAQFRAFTYATTACLLSVVLFRAVIQQRWGQATGLDIGNWLTLGRSWLGGSVSSAGSTYPPVIPVLAALLESVLPLQYAAMVLGATGTALLGGGTAAVMWRAGCGWWSLPLAVLVSAGSAVGEALAWGGLPQVFSLGLSVVALYLLGEVLGSPRSKPAWLLGLVLLALGATSHLVLAIVVAAGMIMLALRLTWRIPRPTWTRVRYFCGVCLRVILPCLLLAPLYLRLLTTVGDSFATRAETQDLTDLFQAVDGVVRELPLLWRPAIVFTLLLPIVLWRERRRPLWLVNAGLAVLMGGLAIVSPEPRFAYIIPLMVVSGFGLLAVSGTVVTRPLLRGAGASVLILAAAVMSFRGVAMFPDQVRYYGSLIPQGTTEALDALQARTDPDAVVLTPPVRGTPFGWWVEGYGKRDTVVGSSTLWLNFGEERDRALLAIDLFSQTDLLSDRWFNQVAEAGIDVVYLPANFDGVSERLRENAAIMDPDRVIYLGDAALIMEVPRAR